MAADLLTKAGLPAAATPPTQVTITDELAGIVTAVTAVTGVCDAVDDLIVPGAFAHTLTVRKPKVVDHHSWGSMAGRCLSVEEWYPGDPRLPEKTKDGQPWPAAAGALVAVMQYNLRSEKGRDSFEWVRFYAETNEAEFSIGYKVPDGKARKRKDGVRVILMVDLYEFSHVLFGAHPLTMAIDVKEAGLASASGGAATVPTLGREEELDPVDPDEPSDGLEGLEGKVSAGWAAHEGNPEALRKWYDAGADGAIAWGTPGDFDRCVAVASAHMTPEQAKGFCNLRHHDALGIYPATHAKLERAAEGKTAAAAVKAALAGVAPQFAEIPDLIANHIPTTASTPLEEKSMTYMTGSLEERRDQLDCAVRALFCKDDGDNEHTWVHLRATFPTEVIVTVERDGEEKNYLINYTADEDGAVALAEPEEVELSLVATTLDGDQVDGDADNGGEADEEQVAELLAAQLMSKLTETKSLARIAGVTSTELRAAAQAIFEGLGGKAAPNPDDEQAKNDRDPGVLPPTPATSPVPDTTDGDTPPAGESTDTPQDTPTAAADPDGDGDAAGDTDDDGDGEPVDGADTVDDYADDEGDDASVGTDDSDTGTPVTDDTKPDEATKGADEGGMVTIDPDEHYKMLEDLGDDEDPSDNE